MHHIFLCALVFVLAWSSVTVAAQEINKGDMLDPRFSIDQTPVSVGGASLQSQDGSTKTRISNAGPTALDLRVDSPRVDSNAAAKGMILTKDILQQQSPLGMQTMRPVVLSEFQKFIAEGTGKILPMFGADFFANAPSTFAPIANSPVPADYLLGPGDELLIRGWGTIDIDYRATIDRNGLINMPMIGSVVLGGVRAGDAEAIIRGTVAKLYKGVTLSVNFGQLRAITVYVVGQASRPGTYTVSNMSTLVTALFASGGPNANGSMRRVQVKRNGKVVAELDLNAFIAHGDKSADIRLQDGDAIYIPAASGYVALIGKVNTPAIYELYSTDDTVESLLKLAGGLPIVADPRRAFLERIDPQKNQPRTVEQFALDASGVKRVLKNGDMLNVMAITTEFSDAVILRGNVVQAIRAHYTTGMRISDLIPSREYLISRSSIQRQNNALNIGNPTNNFSDDNSDNFNNKFKPNNSNNFFNYNNFNNTNNKTNTGSNTNPTANIAAHIGSLIEEINWDYAVIERINRTDLTVSLISFNLGKVFENPDGADNIFLQPGDTVTILSQDDVAVPIEKRRIFVRVEGEVNVPGVYQMKRGDDLHDLLARAGGPTRSGYVFGTAFYREQVRIEQQANMEKVIDRLERQLRLEQAKGIVENRGLIDGDAKMTELRRQAELASSRETVQRLRKLAATGRISLGLDPNERSFNKLPHLKLENGDRLVVPFRPEFVHIFGAVNSEASALWRPGLRVSDYLDRTGLRQEADMDEVFIIKTDGSIAGGASTGWFLRTSGSDEVGPGDSIVVPEKNFSKEGVWSRFTNGAKDWAQIFANFGLGAAALKVLK
jgi:protein involved in polysaccharide export with SLBB domain